MANAKQIERAESVFQRYERREAEINDALKQEAARHAAVVKNMGRLRALRLSRNETRKCGARPLIDGWHGGQATGKVEKACGAHESV